MPHYMIKAWIDLKRLAATLTRDMVFPTYALNRKSYKSAHRHPRFEFEFTEADGHTLLFGTPSEYGAIHHFGGSSGMSPQNAAIPTRP